MRNDDRYIKRKKREINRKRQRAKIKSIFFCLFIVALLIILMFRVRSIALRLDELENAMDQIEVMANIESVTITDESGKKAQGEKEREETDYVETVEITNVERPMRLALPEAIQKLDELAKDNTTIEEIFNNNASYPEDFLTALANNPEMADFVAGYLDEREAVESELTESEKKQEFPLFLQWDPRWGYKPYGNNVMGLTGCGPTCMAMTLYYLTNDETNTPDKLAIYGIENGYYVDGTGTAWAFMDDIPLRYGIRVTTPGLAENEMKNALDKDGIIICAMSQGDFTAYGHFIVIYGYDEEGFRVNDPNCVARSRRRWTFNELEPQINKIWAYYK